MSEDAPPDERPARRRWRLPLSWVGLVAVACVLYELTQSPALASVLVCLKFGWEDFLVARWLSRHDPLRCRRHATFWLYVAWGLWKTALVAFLMSLGFALVTPPNAPAGVPQALFAFAGTFLLTLVALGLSMVMTGLAVLGAWYGGFRLWLDRAVHRARRHDDWPPTPWCQGNKNRLAQLLNTALGAATVALLLAIMAALARTGFVGAAVTFVLTISAPVVLLLCREVVYRQVWADRPDECWPVDEE
jgi:hypothetical protein